MNVISATLYQEHYTGIIIITVMPVDVLILVRMRMLTRASRYRIIVSYRISSNSSRAVY